MIVVYCCCRWIRSRNRDNSNMGNGGVTVERVGQNAMQMNLFHRGQQATSHSGNNIPVAMPVASAPAVAQVSPMYAAGFGVSSPPPAYDSYASPPPVYDDYNAAGGAAYEGEVVYGDPIDKNMNPD